MLKKIIIIGLVTFGALVGLFILIFLSYLWLTSGERQELLKDEYNRKIIEYWDMDTNELKLKLFEYGKSYWIKHPACCMKYEGRISNNTIKFDRSTSNTLNVNGEAFTIEEVK